MEVKNVKINKLKPAEYNPRGLTEKEKEDLVKSIKKFGMVEPIVVNEAKKRKNIIIGGHQRYYICKELEWKEIPVVYVNIPNIKKEQELNLRLNKNNGHWDNDLLANFDEEILLNVGFESEELDDMFNLEVEEDDFDAEEEYKKIKKPKVKKGEVYILGSHRLMCGDSMSDRDVKKLTQGNLGRLIFTDPPYNVDYKSPGDLSYHSKKFGGSGGKIFNDKKSEEECVKFYGETLKNFYKYTTDDVTIYWWYASKNDWLNRRVFLENDWHISQDIIWLKNGMIFSHGQDYHRIYEPCMVGWKKGKKHYCNKKINNLKEAFNLDFEDFNEMLDVWYEKRDVTSKYVHPTQKPVRLAERALKKNSKIGDIVLDFFGGSGSTLIACEQLNRKAYLMELDPKYVEVIMKRWEKMTGKEVERDGK